MPDVEEGESTDCNLRIPNTANPSVKTSVSNVPTSPNNSSTSLVVPGCIPIPSKLLHLFMNSMLLVHYLEPFRDGHTDRIPLPSIGSNVRKEYRRDLQDKLAYLCDRVKGGTTITAIGFEERDGKVVVHAASNCSENCSHIPGFLKKTISYLSTITQKNKKDVEDAILDDAILLASSKEIARLRWYAKALHRCLLGRRSWKDFGMLSSNSNTQF